MPNNIIRIFRLVVHHRGYWFDMQHRSIHTVPHRSHRSGPKIEAAQGIADPLRSATRNKSLDAPPHSSSYTKIIKSKYNFQLITIDGATMFSNVLLKKFESNHVNLGFKRFGKNGTKIYAKQRIYFSKLSVQTSFVLKLLRCELKFLAQSEHCLESVSLLVN